MNEYDNQKDYTRGHLVPLGNHKKDESHQAETFTTTNVSPQNKQFNCGIWNHLDQTVRGLLKGKDIEGVHVLTGPVFCKETPTTYLTEKRNIPVPTHFFKIVITQNCNAACKANPKTVFRMSCFLMENRDTENLKLSDCLVEYKEIEELVPNLGFRWDPVALDLNKIKGFGPEIMYFCITECRESKDIPKNPGFVPSITYDEIRQPFGAQFSPFFAAIEAMDIDSNFGMLQFWLLLYYIAKVEHTGEKIENGEYHANGEPYGRAWTPFFNVVEKYNNGLLKVVDYKLKNVNKLDINGPQDPLAMLIMLIFLSGYADLANQLGNEYIRYKGCQIHTQKRC